MHLDVRNAAYNPRGAYSAEDLRFPFDGSTFDLISLKTVFTQMRVRELDNYVGEITRLLVPGGVCLATFFLLNAA